MASALEALGDLDNAIKAYRKTIQLKPDFAEAYNNLGTTLQRRGKLNEAIEAYKMAIETKPKYDEAYSNLGIILRGVALKAIDVNLEDKLLYLLQKKTLVIPREIARAIVSLVKFEPSIDYLLSPGYKRPDFKSDTFRTNFVNMQFKTIN